MELTVELAGIPIRLSLRSAAYAPFLQPFRTEADPVAAVRVPEDALKEAAPHYEAGTTPEQVEYLRASVGMYLFTEVNHNDDIAECRATDILESHVIAEIPVSAAAVCRHRPWHIYLFTMPDGRQITFNDAGEITNIQ